MSILDTIARTISAPLSVFFPRDNGIRVASHPNPQNSGHTNIQQSRPMSTPILSPSAELDNISREMGLAVTTMHDKEAMLYLPTMRQKLAEFRVQRAEKAQELHKYNLGQQEIERKGMQRHQNEINSYQAEQNRRTANASQVAAKHNSENQQYITYLNSQPRTSEYVPLTIQYNG